MVDTFRKKTMSHWEASNWLRRFYWALDHHNDLGFRIRKDLTDPEKRVKRKVFGIHGLISGLYEPDIKNRQGIKHLISLNPSRRRYGGIVKIAIHETIHHIKAEWNEGKVKEHENLIYEALTDKQLWNLMKRVFSR